MQELPSGYKSVPGYEKYTDGHGNAYPKVSGVGPILQVFVKDGVINYCIYQRKVISLYCN